MPSLQINNSKPKYLTFLSMLAAVLWVICLTSQQQLISIYSGYICAAVLPYPFLCCIFDIIAELYGYQEARRTLWSAFITLLVFAFSIYIFTLLPAPLFWKNYTAAFNTALGPIIRIVAFGSLAFIVGQYINIYIFSKLRIVMKGKFFAFRSIGSTFLGDTITFAIALFGDFSGKIPSHTIFVLVIDELIIMYVMAIILAIPASLTVKILKKIEPTFNSGVNFNPFK